MSDFWTDERVERLQLLRRNKWSMGKIAVDLKCSRNAVIGKLHRLSNRPTTPRVPPDWNLRKAIILDVQANNLPGRVAALRLGLAYDTTLRYAKALGIPFPMRSGDMRGQRATVSVPRAPSPPKDRPSIKGVRQAPVAVKTPPVVSDDAITFMAIRDGVTDLRGNFTPGTCKYEVTGSEHPKDFLFCGADTVQGTPWCPIHNAVTTVPVPGRQQIYASRR